MEIKPPPRDQWRDPAEITTATIILGGGIYDMTTIEHESTLWLVPDWFEHETEGWMMPARMVSLATVQHERMGDGRVVVNEPLPSDLRPPSDPLETAKRTLVIDTPAIFFAIPSAN
jgi:hypothetical protein